jgi:RNA polymerase sigma-70 factor (ECF subfamily)
MAVQEPAGAELTTSTNTLLDRVLRGESDALDRLFRRAGRRIMALVCYRSSQRLKRLMEPEDILQEVYVEALKQLPHFEKRERSSFYAWLATIAVNKIRNLEHLARAAKRDPLRQVPLKLSDDSSNPGGMPASQIAEEQTSPSGLTIRWEVFELVDRAIRQLSTSMREVLVLRYLEGLPADEIARTLHMTRDHVYKVASRGLAKLRDRIGSF